jgi:hypothetical protein
MTDAFDLNRQQEEHGLQQRTGVRLSERGTFDRGSTVEVSEDQTHITEVSKIMARPRIVRPVRCSRRKSLREWKLSR